VNDRQAGSDLEEALRLEPTGEAWVANADPRYESINGMFGGWTAAVLLLATMERASASHGPSALTVNYVDKVETGSRPIVRVDHVGGSRSLQHWHTRLLAADEERTLASAMLLFSDRRETDGFLEPVVPDAPDPELLEVFHPPGTAGERTIIRPISGHPPWNRGSTVSSAWAREKTGRRFDHAQLAYLADAYAPRVFFIADGPRMSATLTLSVYFHGTDDEIAAVGDGYILNEAIGTRATTSTSGQQARLWSADGALLATTEQLCWYR
jgi:acyl-CoA thioesterase